MDKKKKVSIRALLLLLCVTLVLVTGVITGSLSISAGDTALADQRDTSDRGMASCFQGGQVALERQKDVATRGTASAFAVGEENTRMMAERMMRTLVSEIMAKVLGYVQAPRTVGLLIQAIAESQPASAHYAEDGCTTGACNGVWAQHNLRPLLYGYLQAMRKQSIGLTETMYARTMHLKGPNEAEPNPAMAIMELAGVMENPETIGNPPDGTHYYNSVQVPGPNSPLVAGTSNEFGLIIDMNCTTDEERSEMKNRGEPVRSGACELTTPPAPAMFRARDVDWGLHWGPIESKGPSITLPMYNSWGHASLPSDKRAGLAWGGISIVGISGFIRELPLPAHSRMYIVQTNNWTGTVGYMLGSSHADAFFSYDEGTIVRGMNDVEQILATDSMDPVIRANAEFILQYTRTGSDREDSEEVCPWRFGTATGGEKYLGCMDGTECDTDGPMSWFCCVPHGGRAKCPSYLPQMCATKGCVGGQDHCCETRCGNFMGVRECYDDDNEAKLKGITEAQSFGRFDVAELHEWWYEPPGGARQLYWMKIGLIDDGFGLRAHNVLLVRRDELMKAIDEATVSTQATIDTETKQTEAQIERETVRTKATIDKENQETEDAKNKSFVVMIVILIPCVFLLLSAGVVFALRVTAPLRELERQMAEVAQMHLEGIDMDARSRLTEVQMMQRSFYRMVKNLKEFRNYMPQSLILEDDDDDAAEEAEATAHLHKSNMRKSGRVGGSEAASAQSGSRRSQRSQVTATRGGTVVASAASSASTHMRKFMQKAVGESLKKKKSTFTAAAIAGWHKGTEGLPHQEINTLHSNIIQGMLAEGQQAKGVADTFSGDRLFISFNGVKPYAEHKMGACIAAVRIRKFVEKDAAGHALTFSAGVCTGEVRAGNMGCAGMKKFTFLGSTVTYVYAVERLNRSLGCAGLADGSVRADLSGRFSFRTTDAVMFPKKSKQMMKVFEIGEEQGASEDEWMYQLEEAEGKDPNKAWNDAVRPIFDGEFPPGFEDVLHSVGAGVPPAVVERVRAAWLEKNLAPTQLLYH